MRKISAIKKTIDGLARNTLTLRNKYHVALCEVAGHTFEHGDPRLFDDILNGATGMARKDMIKWINANGFARVTKEGCVVRKAGREDRSHVDGDAAIAYLMDLPKWYEAEQSIEKIIKDLDVQALLSMIHKKLDDAEENGAAVTNKDPQATAKLLDLMAERAKRAA
tara:strand:+ start:347 stop:844 length:498 start_codon:yes stop_codon:yes gene_type:complete